MQDNLFANAVNLWKDIVAVDKSAKLELQLEAYKKLFQVFHIGNFYFYVFDFVQMDREFLSEEIEQVLGYPPSLAVQEFLSYVHPEDSIYYLNFENAAIHFLKSLPYEKIGRYKVQYDFRVRNAQGKYVRLLHQAILIDFDREKNFYRSLGLHTDIDFLKRTGPPSLSFIGLDGEPSFTNVAVPELFKTGSNNFTRREKEIIKLIVSGKTSDEIAAELFISPHTVSTHRKNILSKAKVRTPAELISMAIDNGWA